MCAACRPPGHPADHFGCRLAEAMHLRDDYKASALACLLEVNESTISRWKQGQAITVPNAIALCEALDISMDWLLRGIGPITSLPPEATSERATLPRISDRTYTEVNALLIFAKSRNTQPSCV